MIAGEETNLCRTSTVRGTDPVLDVPAGTTVCTGSCSPSTSKSKLPVNAAVCRHDSHLTSRDVASDGNVRVCSKLAKYRDLVVGGRGGGQGGWLGGSELKKK